MENHRVRSERTHLPCSDKLLFWEKGDWRFHAGECSVDLSVLERSILSLQHGGPTGGREGSSLDFGAVIQRSVRERWSWALTKAGRGKIWESWWLSVCGPQGDSRRGCGWHPHVWWGHFGSLKIVYHVSSQGNVYINAVLLGTGGGLKKTFFSPKFLS